MAQWHYKLKIDESCREPNTDLANRFLIEAFGGDIVHPSVAYYPPGLICAKEVRGQYCLFGDIEMTNRTCFDIDLAKNTCNTSQPDLGAGCQFQLDPGEDCDDLIICHHHQINLFPHNY